MGKYTALLAIAIGLFPSFDSFAQTPEQQQLWEAQRAQALAEEKTKAEHLAREREARKADPMAWVRTLSPMTAGGWEFRAVANDGSWAIYRTNQTTKRSLKLVTFCLQHECAESKSGSEGKFLTVVQKVQEAC